MKTAFITNVRSYVGSKVFLMDALKVLVGSGFLALISLFKVPLYPTPLTLQTLGVFLLGFALGPRKGALAVVAYLAEASMGMPVLSGAHVNPLWMISPNGGFLLSFIPAAFCAGWIMEKMTHKNFITALVAATIAHLCIYVMGISWLSYFFGLQKAIMVGLVPFVGTTIIKIGLAAALYAPIRKLKEKIA